MEHKETVRPKDGKGKATQSGATGTGTTPTDPWSPLKCSAEKFTGPRVLNAGVDSLGRFLIQTLDITGKTKWYVIQAFPVGKDSEKAEFKVELKIAGVDPDSADLVRLPEGEEIPCPPIDLRPVCELTRGNA